MTEPHLSESKLNFWSTGNSFYRSMCELLVIEKGLGRDPAEPKASGRL